MRESGLRPTWGLDAENPQAADAHEGTEEHIREAHRDRQTVDCGNSGMSPDMDILESLARDCWRLMVLTQTNLRAHSVPSEPAPPPHPAGGQCVLTVVSRHWIACET